MAVGAHCDTDRSAGAGHTPQLAFVTALLVSLEDHVGAVDRRQRNRSSGGAKGEEEEEEEEEAKALEGCC